MIKSKLSRVLQSALCIALHEYHRFDNTIYTAERRTSKRHVAISSVFQSFQDSSYCEVYLDLFSIRRSGLGNVEVEKHIANITIKETVIETVRAICTRRCFFPFLFERTISTGQVFNWQRLVQFSPENSQKKVWSSCFTGNECHYIAFALQSLFNVRALLF